eukprot:scaffold4247_cov93-Isochrysis_galbana.AAC.2
MPLRRGCWGAKCGRRPSRSTSWGTPTSSRPWRRPRPPWTGSGSAATTGQASHSRTVSRTATTTHGWCRTTWMGSRRHRPSRRRRPAPRE